MTIKEFINGYNQCEDDLKKKFLCDNLKIKTYLPFLNKTELAQRIARISMLNKETGNINVQSEVSYLLFCRAVIENYTYLTVETEGFYEEYDLLNEYGILDKIMGMIPEKELKEFKMLCDYKQSDIMINMGTPKAFINQQVERITTISSTILKPVLDKVANTLNNMDEKDIEKLASKLEKVIKRVKWNIFNGLWCKRRKYE